MENLIQIAGAIDFDDAETIIESGANFLGLPLILDVHKPDMDLKTAATLVAKVKSRINPVLITYQYKAEDIIKTVEYLNVDFVQIHGPILSSELIKIKRIHKNLEIIKSIIIGDSQLENLLEEVKLLEDNVDYFITDTFDPNTGASGATGKIHDWNISEKIVNSTNKPVILAGGLNSNNVFEAVSKVQPFGVDSHSGVEDSYGRKDIKKLKLFEENAKRAFSLIHSH